MAPWAEAYASFAGTDLACDGGDRVEDKKGAVGDGAAVDVCADVRDRLGELVREIAVR